MNVLSSNHGDPMSAMDNFRDLVPSPNNAKNVVYDKMKPISG